MSPFGNCILYKKACFLYPKQNLSSVLIFEPLGLQRPKEKAVNVTEEFNVRHFAVMSDNNVATIRGVEPIFVTRNVTSRKIEENHTLIHFNFRNKT